MARSFNGFVAATRAIALLLTCSCAPPTPMPDASADIGVDSPQTPDAGTDASFEPPDAFAFDASLDDIRVVYAQNLGCRVAEGEACGPVRGAFNTLEECAMACGRLERMPFSVRYQPGSGGKKGFRSGPLDFSPVCSAVLVRHGVSPAGTSRCAHLGFLAPLYDGTESSVRVPASMSNQEVWELLNAAEMMPIVSPGGTRMLCGTP